MNIALLLSGGTGVRLGESIPKQYLSVEGRPVIAYARENPGAVTVALPSRKWSSLYDHAEKFQGFCLPGANRQLSILQGLEDIKGYADNRDCIFIHDAARPLLSEHQITECLKAVRGHDGVIPVLPMKDTVYTSKDGKTISALVKRNEVFAGQAPEVFRLGKYYEANRRLLPDKILQINGSTEPAVMAGMDIAMIPGDEGNFKITTKMDLERFECVVKGKSSIVLCD